jgi:hypothetical protein
MKILSAFLKQSKSLVVIVIATLFLSTTVIVSWGLVFNHQTSPIGTKVSNSKNLPSVQQTVEPSKTPTTTSLNNLSNIIKSSPTVYTPIPTLNPITIPKVTIPTYTPITFPTWPTVAYPTFTPIPTVNPCSIIDTCVIPESAYSQVTITGIVNNFDSDIYTVTFQNNSSYTLTKETFKVIFTDSSGNVADTEYPSSFTTVRPGDTVAGTLLITTALYPLSNYKMTININGIYYTEGF